MSNLYQNLSTVRTSIMNVIAHSYFDGKQRNGAKILQKAAEELSDGSFVAELLELELEELLDLGFGYFDETLDGSLMLFPVWLLPFIPNGTVLEAADGASVEVGMDTISPYADHWLIVGIRY